MSRILTVTGVVKTQPEAKRSKGKGSDFVKFRLLTKEFGEREPWYFTVLCYGRTAKTALDKFKIDDNLMVTSRVLPPMSGSTNTDLTVVMLDFKWLRSEVIENKTASQEESFTFEIEDVVDFGDIPTE